MLLARVLGPPQQLSSQGKLQCDLRVWQAQPCGVPYMIEQKWSTPCCYERGAGLQGKWGGG
jgi:hypothetical protein